jgi:hypothetical protein
VLNTRLIPSDPMGSPRRTVDRRHRSEERLLRCRDRVEAPLSSSALRLDILEAPKSPSDGRAVLPPNSAIPSGVPSSLRLRSEERGLRPSSVPSSLRLRSEERGLRPSSVPFGPRLRSEERGQGPAGLPSSVARASADHVSRSSRFFLRASRRGYREQDTTVSRHRERSGERLDAVTCRSRLERSSVRPPVLAGPRSVAPASVRAPKSASAVRGCGPGATPSVVACRRSDAVSRRTPPPASSVRRSSGRLVVVPRRDLSHPKTTSIKLGDESKPASAWSGCHARQ